MHAPRKLHLGIQASLQPTIITMALDSSYNDQTDLPEGENPQASTSSATNRIGRIVRLEGEALDTFSFNVSAAEAADLKRKQHTASSKESFPPSNRLIDYDWSSKAESSSSPQSRQEVPEEHDDYFHIVITPKPQRKSPSWAASLLLHAALLLPFGFLTQPAPPTSPEHDILLSLEPSENIDDQEMFEDIELVSSEELIYDESVASTSFTANDTSVTNLSADTALEEATGEVALPTSGLQDLGSLFSNGNQKITDSGNILSGMPQAEFFGTKVEGNRIVYIVDNSGGMKSGELETLITELQRSVDSLSQKQYFYVIFYSDSLYPLFYPEAPQHFVLATNENKLRLEAWLETVELCLGNVVDEALAAAISIRPDAIYLLTDGDLDTTRDQRRMRFLLDSAGRDFPVHTFGMGTSESGKAAEKLKQVAAANHGTFRAVEVSPDAVALARIKARPYHNKTAGKVWGLRVGKRSR